MVDQFRMGTCSIRPAATLECIPQATALGRGEPSRSAAIGGREQPSGRATTGQEQSLEVFSQANASGWFLSLKSEISMTADAQSSH